MTYVVKDPCVLCEKVEAEASVELDGQIVGVCGDCLDDAFEDSGPPGRNREGDPTLNGAWVA